MRQVQKKPGVESGANLPQFITQPEVEETQELDYDQVETPITLTEIPTNPDAQFEAQGTIDPIIYIESPVTTEENTDPDTHSMTEIPIDPVVVTPVAPQQTAKQKFKAFLAKSLSCFTQPE